MKTLTEKIMATTAPWDNPYQGEDKRVVFVCSAGILRSATAARLYASKYNTRAAGSEPYALVPLTNDLIVWAQEIVFMNPTNFDSANKRHDLNDVMAKVKILKIPDVYEHMHPQLIQKIQDEYEYL